jgi:hypothetical protein
MRFDGVFYQAHGSISELTIIEIRRLNLLFKIVVPGLFILGVIFMTVFGGLEGFIYSLMIFGFIGIIAEVVIFARIKYLEIVYQGRPISSLLNISKKRQSYRRY